MKIKSLVPEFSGIETKRFRKLLFDKPFIKFVLLIVLQALLLRFGKEFDYHNYMHYFVTAVSLLISVYFVIVIVYVFTKSINRLKNTQSLVSLIWEYTIFVAGILLIFTMAFSLVQSAGVGYLTYGQCSDYFNPNQISMDSQISTDYFYFSTITFFSVGYGDICPMGFSKWVAMATTFVGHLITVIFLGLILNNYIRKRNKRKELEK